MADSLAPLTAMLGEAAQAVPLGLEPELKAAGDGWVAPADILEEQVEQTAGRWDAPPHVAAALWWKGFAYWTSLPVSLGWALNRTIPLMTSDAVAMRSLAESPYMVVGLTQVRAGTDVRSGLIEQQAPLVDALHKLTRVGRRTLWGSVAESLALPIMSYGERLQIDPEREAAALLETAGLADLFDLPARRRTCCLWVTLPDREACRTCCIISQP